MQPAWVTAHSAPPGTGSATDARARPQGPPGLPSSERLPAYGARGPLLPPGIPIRTPHSSVTQLAGPSPVLYQANNGYPSPMQIENSQVMLGSVPSPFPLHHPRHPVQNSKAASYSHLLSHTPSQIALDGHPPPNFQGGTPIPPPPGIPHPSLHLVPEPFYTSPSITPPSPSHPPGSHSTFLTISMEQKAKALKKLVYPASPQPSSSAAVVADNTTNSTVLSRFAPLYVPLWLRQVNTSIPTLVFPLAPSSELEIYSSLVADLYPPNLLSDIKKAEEATTGRIRDHLAKNQTLSTLSSPDFDHSAPPSSAGRRKFDLDPLTRSTYATRWIPLQALEYSAREFELFESTLYNVSLRPYGSSLSSSSTTTTNRGNGQMNELYSLPTPFIRESWPPVQMGDTCFVRPLAPAVQGWHGVEVEARVYAIERVKGQVVLRVDPRASEWLRRPVVEDDEVPARDGRNGTTETDSAQQGIKVNVIWKIQDRYFEDWKRATEIVDLHLYTPSDSPAETAHGQANGSRLTKTPRRRSPIRSWLFPTDNDLADSENFGNVPSLLGRRWVDANLNDEQKSAVQSILWAKQRAPLLISGPPGTGKTKTLVESVFQILKEYPNARVLVCGASNPSTDTLALRLRSLMPSQLLRLNHPTRPFNEVRGELLPFCHVDGEAFGIPDIATLLAKRVVCTTVNDCSILLSSRLTNSNLSSLESHLASRLYPTRTRLPGSPHFNYLLIDEAGQATESDLLPALAVVLTDSDLSDPAHVTICGDANQLSPHIVSAVARDHDFDVSLLERLLRRPLYADHPYSRKNRRRNPEVEWDVRTTPFVDLVRNYRSVEEILWLPSTLFYHESLVACASRSIQDTPLRNWSRLANASFPILFEHSAGEDFEVEEGSSFYNPSEIHRVVELVEDLVRDGDARGHGRVRARDVSVISPFREQVWRIRLALRRASLGDVDVGNVEALQGAENRVVIVSPVRSVNTRWIEHDRQSNRGLIFEPKRFNVAMTRAKEVLIVVGNADTLTVDPYWRAFYQLCVRNQCYVGPRLGTIVSNSTSSNASSDGRDDPGQDLSSAAQAVSKMEMEYRARKAHGPDEGDVAREFDITVGRMVTLLDVGED